MQRGTTLVLALLVVCSGGSAVACLWDYDTLAMEMKRFPDTLELIAGKFLRHSDDFYHWRVSDRQAKLKETPDDLRLIDDLAVAFDKLGRHDDAIGLMEEQLESDGNRYETHANLGTFLIHSGKLADGVKHIDKAIEINPNAHFGREIYQGHLVRYLLAQGYEEGAPIELPMREDTESFMPVGFAKYVLDQESSGNDKSRKEQGRTAKLAIKGVLGMMRFGQHDSPVLLESLGDLLLVSMNEDAKRLATRAYLKASYEVKGEASNKYRALAEQALKMQVVNRGNSRQVTLAAVEAALQREVQDARQWVSGVHADEAKWIASGVDVDAEFSKKYYSKPQVYEADANVAVFWKVILIVAVLGFAVLVGGLLMRRIGRSAVDPKQAQMKPKPQ